MPKVSEFTGFRELKLSTKRMVQSLFYNYSENNKAKNTKPIMKINYLNNMGSVHYEENMEHL